MKILLCNGHYAIVKCENGEDHEDPPQNLAKPFGRIYIEENNDCNGEDDT